MSESRLAGLKDEQDYIRIENNPANPKMSESGFTGLKDKLDFKNKNGYNEI